MKEVWCVQRCCQCSPPVRLNSLSFSLWLLRKTSFCPLTLFPWTPQTSPMTYLMLSAVFSMSFMTSLRMRMAQVFVYLLYIFFYADKHNPESLKLWSWPYIFVLRFPDQVKLPFVPDWANQELKQGSCLRRNGLVEEWFPLSDQSGISCHLMESMRFGIFHSSFILQD